MKELDNTKIICVVGPTAAGKSELAVKLCKCFNAEVISCDSMQLYRGMNIGTAKATDEEMGKVPHHMLDILDINDAFSVSDYVKMAKECIKDISSRGKIPVFCGGTGLYIDSVINGLCFGEYSELPEYRQQLEKLAEEQGAQTLFEMLEKCDKEAAKKIDKENIKRVIRALEVYKVTGIPISVWNKRALDNARPMDALYIGITYYDRQKLYKRIEERVDLMLEKGILEETRILCQRGLRQSKTAGQAIGYKEFYPYLDSQATLEECVERLKINTRHYAKRQLTWFAKNEKINWLYRDIDTDEVMLEKAKALCKDYLNK